MKKYSRKKLSEATLELLEKYPREEVVKLLAQEIISQKRTNELEIIIKEIGKQLLVKKGHLDTEIFSAHKLQSSIKEELTDLLKKITKAKTVSINSVLDPSTLGGFKAITPVVEINGSIKDKINQLKATAHV